MTELSRKVRRGGALALIPALGVAIGLSAVAPAGASSHREAPLISQDPVADATDVYAFVSPDRPDTVTFVANYIPFENPAGGPNFDRFGDDVLYRINVDTDGDAIDNIRYDFRFETKIANKNTYLYNTGQVTSIDDPDLNIRQTYSVTKMKDNKTTMLASGLRVPPANVGPVSTPNYEAIAKGGIYNVDGASKVFAGPRDDSFFVDLGSIFDLGQLRPFLPAYKPAPRNAMAGKNSTGGFNLHSIVLQVPIKDLTEDGKGISGADDPRAVIGVRTTSLRRQTRVMMDDGSGGQQHSGDWMQVSRLGNPLVNELVIPLGDKNRFNYSTPQNDGQFLKYVLDPEPAKLINLLYGIPVPKAPRNDFVAVFLTGIAGLNQPPNVVASEQLRLNMGIPATARNKVNALGVLGGDLAGYPNGRRLGDDVVDIALRLSAGGTPFTPGFNKSPNNDLGDGVNKNDMPYLAGFPYVSTPHSGFVDNNASPGSTFVPPLKP